jgi:hypothetical protein
MDNFTISLIVAVVVGVCVTVLGKMWQANQKKDD